MLVVPIAKDKILTKDKQVLTVIEYTNYKDGGPAVYARTPSKDVVVVYFFDIAEINGTRVEYERGSKVFKALGKVSRAQHLPQEDDKVLVLVNRISDEDEAETGKMRKEVVGLKLRSKSLGINKGMFVKCADGESYRIKNILDIDRAIGDSSFNRDEFASIYKEYMGV